ncbi:MAG: TPR end-of-group domain-containing protein, partial [Burkholderiales bacterium]
GLGKGEEAVATGRKALGLMPTARDAIVGPLIAQGLAIAYAWTGDPEHAMDLLEPLLRQPSHLTAHTIRLDPAWDPLRGHARFQKILSDYQPHDE